MTDRIDQHAAAIVDRVGTPTYVYDWQAIEQRFYEVSQAFANVDTTIFYAVKANSNLALLNLLASLGSGFDVVSGGELERVIEAGGDPSKTIFSGVGKTVEEITFAIKLGVGAINIESVGEYQRILELANHLQLTANVMFRVNPNIEVDTHPYITTGLHETKFGLPVETVLDLYRTAGDEQYLRLSGIAAHLGSQIGEPDPYLELARALGSLRALLLAEGQSCPRINIGGGFGISYLDEPTLDVADLGNRIATEFVEQGISIGLEPGRYLVAEAGTLLTSVVYLKPALGKSSKNFIVIDAAMNDLIRPALYEAHHRIENLSQNEIQENESQLWDVVGPVCESGDFLGTDRKLVVAQDDLLAIRDVGAYGHVQSSNYNSRGRCAEVLVDGDNFHVIRRRESIRDQWRLESMVDL